MSEPWRLEQRDPTEAFSPRMRALEAQGAERRDAPSSGQQQRDRLFDLALEMLCVAGTDGYFKQINPAFERTLGYSRQELLARPFVDFVHPEDRQKTLDELERLRAGTPTVCFENRYRCRDGSYRWLAWTALPRQHEQLIYATASDVTARKRAEQRFHLLLESAPDSMVIVDREGRIVLVNAQTERLFGYTRAELIGQPVEVLVPERVRAAHAQARRGYHARPEARPMGSRPDLSCRRKDGSQFIAEISLSPIETEEGLLVASAIRDVTERRRAEGAARQNEVQLLAAQKIQEALLPRAAPALPGFDIAGATYPAEFAAGDHFDYLAMYGGNTGIVVGDVSGHGFSAALVMALTHAYLRSLAQVYYQTEDILARTNQLLAEELEDDRFVTLFFARLDPRSRKLSYVNAGHPSAYVLDGSGELRHCLESTSLPLGVLPDSPFVTGEAVSLCPGDLVLLLTDGVLEAASPDREEFGPLRTLEVVRANRHEPARQIIASLWRALCDFAQGERLHDDVTAVVLKVGPDQGSRAAKGSAEVGGAGGSDEGPAG